MELLNNANNSPNQLKKGRGGKNYFQKKRIKATFEG